MRVSTKAPLTDLGEGDVGERLGRGVHDVQVLHDRRACAAGFDWVGGWVGGLVGSLVGWPETHDMAAAAAATAHGPSLEMVTPLPLYMSLSMPRGPRVERTESATAWGVCRINNAWVS